MSESETKFSPDEIAKIEQSRALETADLIKGGAQYMPNPEHPENPLLHVPPNKQVEAYFEGRDNAPSVEAVTERPAEKIKNKVTQPETPRAATADTAKSKEQSKETKKEVLNVFGLPVDWSWKTSTEGLEKLTTALADKQTVTREAVDHVLLPYLKEVKKVHDKYKGREDMFNPSVGLLDEKENIQYLKMSRADKIAYLEKRYPEGFPLRKSTPSGSSRIINHIKWNRIVDYDLWAMRNHGQTLNTSAGRGGGILQDVVITLNGLDYNTRELKQYTDEQLIAYLKAADMLME